MKEEALAVLAQSLGKIGVTAEEASKAFDMSDYLMYIGKENKIYENQTVQKC